MSGEAPPRWEERPAFREFGVRVETVGDGIARLTVPRSAVRLRGVRDSINGGVVAWLAEAAMQVCVHSLLGDGERVGATQELSVAYLSAARGEQTAIEARMLRKGRRLAVGEVGVSDVDSGTLNARARVSCEILPA